MKKTLLLASLVFGFSQFAIAGDKADVNGAIDAAKEAQKSTQAVGFEWRDMGKMIKKAEKAAKEGKSDKAIKIANTVVMHSEAALKQAELAKSASPKL